MKKIHFLFFLFLSVLLSQCSDPENDFSAFEYPFERKVLTDVRVNGLPYIEIEYVNENSSEISEIKYYVNGVLNPNYTESVTYKDGKIASKKDKNYTWEYTYNDQGNLSTIDECLLNGGCCTYTYHYSNVNANLPDTLAIRCGSYYELVLFDFKNTANRSYISSAVNNDNNSIEIIQKTKFNEGIIDPLYVIDPSKFDYYFDNIYQNFTAKTLITYEIREHNYYYPTTVYEYIYNTNTLSVDRTNIYTYIYR